MSQMMNTVFRRFQHEVNLHLLPFHVRRQLRFLEVDEAPVLPSDGGEEYKRLYRCRTFTADGHICKPRVNRHPEYVFCADGDLSDSLALRELANYVKSKDEIDDEDWFGHIKSTMGAAGIRPLQETVVKPASEREIALAHAFLSEHKMRIETKEEARQRAFEDAPIELVCRIGAIELIMAPLRALRVEMCDEPQVVSLMGQIFKDCLYTMSESQFETRTNQAQQLAVYIEEWVTTHDYGEAKEHFEAAQAKTPEQSSKKRQLTAPDAPKKQRWARATMHAPSPEACNE